MTAGKQSCMCLCYMYSFHEFLFKDNSVRGAVPPIQRGGIELSQHARNHPLFPMLDDIIRTTRQNQQSLLRIEQSFSRELQSIRSAQVELKELIEKTYKKNFSLKDEGFQVSITSLRLEYSRSNLCFALFII